MRARVLHRDLRGIVRGLSAAVIAAGALVAAAPQATALDHKNLDHGRPLALEDPFPIAYREWNVEIGAGFVHERRAPDRGIWQLSLEHGVALDWQIGLETTLSSEPRSVGGSMKSGDVAVTGLHNFNAETLTVPAFGLAAEIEFPTGVGSRGVDCALRAITLRSSGRLGLLANLGVEWTGSPRGARPLRYAIASGATWPLGAPRNTRLLLLGSVALDQAPEKGQPPVVGAGVGIRYQWAVRTVLDAGIGADLAGAEDRSSFRLTAGWSRAW